ncbi:MAG TPA: S4 domain-containing protein, partial [Coriobacteriia bacterium]|nr:S4 domain-containing protein [Coriobacteriia bacterium]
MSASPSSSSPSFSTRTSHTPSTLPSRAWSRERMTSRHVHAVKGDEAGMRLDRLLGDLDAVVSRSAAQRLIAGGHVLVNGQIAAKNHIVRP